MAPPAGQTLPAFRTGVAMGFAEAIQSVFRQYAGFSGRAPRSEYWWFYLFAVLLFSASILVDIAITGGLEEGDIPFVTSILALGILLPSLALAIRRLHDTDRSGWWYLIGLVPLVGGIILLVFFVTRGTDGPNRFGPDPVARQR